MREKVQLDARRGFPRGFGPSPNWDMESGSVGPSSDGPAGTIYGLVVAEAGAFRDGRGSFDEQALRTIAGLWPAAGLPSALQHANALDDRVSWYLGRCLRVRRGLTLGVDEAGQHISVPCLRCDLQFDPAAKISPQGDLPAYLLSRADTDPASLGASLSLEVEYFQSGGASAWTPLELFGLDVVSCGDATGSLLGYHDLDELITLRRLARERHARLHVDVGKGRTTHRRADAVPPSAPVKAGVPIHFKLGPRLDRDRIEWEVIDHAAIELRDDYSGLPIREVCGRVIAHVGDGATIERDNGRLYLSVPSAAVSPVRAWATLDTTGAQTELRHFHCPDHELHGHKVPTFTSGVRISEILVA